MTTTTHKIKTRCPFRWICIDPGVAATGVAIFDPGPPLRLIDTEVIKSSRELSWERRSFEVAARLSKTLHLYVGGNDVSVYIEFPQHLGASGRGYATAASGGLVKLAVLIGMILGECHVRHVPVTQVPLTWKGNLPKAVIQKRVMRALGVKLPNHAADAAGIGLWVAQEANSSVRQQ